MNIKQQIEKALNGTIASFYFKGLSFLLLFVSGIIIFPIPIAKSDEINLKCIGKFEINRGELIKPDWEISYFKINPVRLKSTIEDQGIRKEGETIIRRNIYTITYKDNNKIETKYKINSTYGTYLVEYLKSNRTLIGTCQKGRG